MDAMQLERAVLGTMLEHNHLIADTVIKEQHFSNVSTQTIFNCFKKLVAEGKAVDTITLTTFEDLSEGIGITELIQMQQMANLKNFESYEKAMLDAYKERETKRVLNDALYNQKTLEEVVSALNSIETHSDNDKSNMRDLAVEFFEQPFQPKQHQRGKSTGLKNLDECLGGLQKTEMMVVAARPSVGKTALATNIAIGATKDNAKVVFFSLEMDKKKIFHRIAAAVGHINLHKFKDLNRFLNDKEKDNWSTLMGVIGAMDFTVYDKPRQSIAEIRSKIRKEQASTDKELVVIIDYLQLIRPDNEKANTNVQVTQVSRDLKQIARDFNVPIVVLSQLNRAGETDKPLLSHLRDSGSIEQDADTVVLLHRPSYQNQEEKENPALELIVAKNRNGETPVLLTHYDRARSIIRDF